MTAIDKPSAWHIVRHADMLEEQAKQARQLAASYEAIPSPIGEYVLQIAAVLREHGLCVIDQRALLAAKVAIEDYDADDDAFFESHKERMRDALVAVNEALSPTAKAGL